MLRKALLALTVVSKLHDLSTKVSKMPRTITEPYDTTKLTSEQKRIIIEEYAEKERTNAAIRSGLSSKNLQTNSQLASRLNARFGLSKSVRSYARIWDGTSSDK